MASPLWKPFTCQICHRQFKNASKHIFQRIWLKYQSCHFASVRSSSMEFFFSPLCEAHRLSSRIYLCLKMSFLVNSLNWLMYEDCSNAEQKIRTWSNTGIKVDFELFLPHISHTFPSYNPGPAVRGLSPADDSLLMSSSVRLTAKGARSPTLPRNQTTEAPWQAQLDLNLRWLQRDFKHLWIGGGDRCSVM